LFVNRYAINMEMLLLMCNFRAKYLMMKRIFTIITFILIAIAGKAQPFQFLYTNVSDASCGSTADGGVCWDVINGFPPYNTVVSNAQYDSNTVFSASCLNGLSANTYTITVEETSGSIISTVITIGVNSPKVKIFASDTVLCNGDSITLSPMFKRNGVIAKNNYCNPIIASTNNEEITNVSIGNLNNSSVCGSLGMQGSIANKYQNYTNLAVTITAGSILPVSISIDECNGGVGSINSTAVFIDYNIDGDFLDPGEQAYLSSTSTSGAHIETGSIFVPNNIQRGITRMRVINATGAPSTIMDCGSYVNGEVEDYTVFFEVAPYQLFWETLGGTGIDTAYSISTAQASTYSLTVDYNDGCSALDTASLSVFVGDLPVVTIVGSNISCPNAFIECNVINTTGTFTYSWLPFTQNTKTISNLVTGVYTCFATDSIGCKGSAIFNMVVTPPMLATPIITNVLCYGDSNGSVNLNMSGGIAPYTFSWSPTQSNSAIATILVAGNYQATVSDGNLCTYSINTTVTQPASILTTLVSSTNASGFGISDGKGKVVAQGGKPNYSYLWSPGGETTNEIVNKPAGTYTITVTDANGCTSFATIIISQPNSIDALQKLYQLQITPNPASNAITLVSSVEIKNITITNMIGQVLITANHCNSTQKEININSLSTGIYTILVNGIVAEKFTVQRN
jgi:GEVED domain/SprB repeat/Secretion system C-terminal sorting domain